MVAFPSASVVTWPRTWPPIVTMTVAPATGAVLSIPTCSTGAIGPRRTSAATPVERSMGPEPQAAMRPPTRPNAPRRLPLARTLTNCHGVQVESDTIGHPDGPAGATTEGPDPEIGLQHGELGRRA